jgi:hypothetical protein
MLFDDFPPQPSLTVGTTTVVDRPVKKRGLHSSPLPLGRKEVSLLYHETVNLFLASY